MRRKYYKVCNGAEKLVLKKNVRYVNCAGRYVARVYNMADEDLLCLLQSTILVCLKVQAFSL